MRTDPELPRDRRSPRLGLRTILPVAALVGAGVRPERLGLSTTPYVLHALSFRGPLSLLLASAGLAVLRGGTTTPGRTRTTAGLALALAGLGQAGIVARRGWACRPVPGRADLVAISLNTLGGAATPEQVAALVLAELPATSSVMVSLPETSPADAARIADRLAAAGHPFQAFSTTEGPRRFDTTSLLLSENLGSYQQVPAPLMLLGAVLATPRSGSGPTFAAVHPGAPVAAVGYPEWATYVSRAVDLCRSNPDSVVAGDFNATIDHGPMRHLEPSFDAAVRAGRGAEGTWPAAFPAPLAAPIDHVLVNGGYDVLGSRTVRVGASDHRAVIVRLRRR
ncbi:endonuclease/exonuclease/phosphatase family protein [Nakamurella panacisegetis]|nr:endonuclease/exonuclease/phosphatase family protein [Nakamurella panacisegetis]